MCLSQDPVHKWADLQRALLTEGQSVWCCKDCIGIIKEDTNATYEEIRVKVEAAAEPLPEVTGVAASTVPTAGESTDHSQEVQVAVAKVEARAVAAEAEAHALKAVLVAKAEAEREVAAASAGVAPKGKSNDGVAASTVPTARESTDHSQAVDFPFEATPALAAMVAKGEAHAEAEAKKASAGVASKGKSINGRGPKRSALIKRIFSKTGRMRKRGPGAVDRSQSIRPSAEAAGRLQSATV